MATKNLVFKIEDGDGNVIHSRTISAVPDVQFDLGDAVDGADDPNS